ncbi:MAG: glutamate-1-semialdehyde 2,1-aminomutase [Chloroflexi bacterium]|nr:glutamate-1-semialdehyde 2,1-aminomutase [Chloroflexota bacterium]
MVQWRWPEPRSTPGGCGSARPGLPRWRPPGTDGPYTAVRAAAADAHGEGSRRGLVNTERSAALFAEAQRLLPGGVSSPVRAFRAVGGGPHFISRAAGSRIVDADGNEFIDYVGSWGPLILGHAHPQVVAAVQEAAARGTSYGAPTELEVELARLITAALPSVELVRFVNSGTEATMSALRVARAFTVRDKIIKFEGCYHGHADGLLVKAGSGVATLGLPDSPGVPASYAQHTLVAPYNDLAAVERIFAANPGQIAGVILEPVAANMGVVPPQPGFLEGLRRLTRDQGALFIFDEVITGFRMGWGGAQGLYGITPDLTCLGKVIGGGLPVGAYGGRRDIMELIAPLGPVYQAGTLSGNPLAMSAGIATLRALQSGAVYEQLEGLSARLADGLAAAARAAGVPVTGNRVGSAMTLFFTDRPVTDWASASTADRAAYGRFFRAMLEQGIYLAPSQFEAAFVSLAHTPADIEATVQAAERALPQVRVAS